MADDDEMARLREEFAERDREREAEMAALRDEVLGPRPTAARDLSRGSKRKLDDHHAASDPDLKRRLRRNKATAEEREAQDREVESDG